MLAYQRLISILRMDTYPGLAADRLRDLVLAPHRRKVERFANDPEVYQLYKRVVEEPPGYCPELRSCHRAVDRRDFDFGVEQREFAIDDIDAAAGRLTP
jgi:hypothetical protein